MRYLTEEDKVNIQKLYEEGKMDSEISKELGIKRGTVLWYRKTHNMPTKFTYGKLSKIKKEELVSLFEQGLSDYKIAKILNVSAEGVYSYRRRHCIIRDIDYRVNSIPFVLTSFQKEVLLGTLLGDASLRVDYQCKNARFSCAHGAKQKEYAEHKAEIFKNLDAKCNYHKRNIPDKRNGKYYEDYTVLMPNNPAFNDLYYAFYKNGKKCIPFELFDNFTGVSLAFMFMDDGCKHGSGYALATNCFTIEDLKKFKAFLYEKFNIDVSIYEKTHILYIKSKDVKHFTELISPYIIECMKYKLHTVS